MTSRLYPRASHATLIGAFAAPLRWIAPVLDDVLAFIAATTAVQRGNAFASTIDSVGGG